MKGSNGRGTVATAAAQGADRKAGKVALEDKVAKRAARRILDMGVDEALDTFGTEGLAIMLEGVCAPAQLEEKIRKTARKLIQEEGL